MTVSPNMRGYLSRLAYLESNGSNAARNPRSGAQGRFQFLPSTLTDARQRLGLNPAALVADDPAIQYPAVANYIRTINPSGYAEIEAGRFSSADQALRGTWPSLPGGGQAQGSARQQQANSYLPGGANANSLPGGGSIAGALPIQAGPPQALGEKNGDPIWKIEVDGQDRTKTIGDRLLSIAVTDYAGQQTDTVELRIDDRGAGVEAPPTGASMRISIGYDGEDLKQMGEFLVDEVGFSNTPREMTIKGLGISDGGEGSGVALPSTATGSPSEGSREYIKLRRTESWHDTTLQEIAGTIAKRSQFRLDVRGLEEIKIRHEDQTNESDANFMTRLAEKYGLVIKPADGLLFVTLRDAGLLGARNILIKQEQVTSWNARTKERARYRVVRAKWIDRKSRKEKVYKITSKEAQSGSTFEIPELFRDEKEAQAAAAAKLSGLTSGVASINLSMPGVPGITAEGVITLEGFRAEIDDQPWVIKTVSHLIGSGGYTTTIESGSPGQEGEGGAAPGSGGARADSIASAADASVGMSTTGSGLGSNACVWAVNRVLARAGVTPPWGGSNYVPDARAALANGGGTKLSGPEPGAIAIMRDSGNPPYPHIGIVRSNGQIISNSNSAGAFSWSASPSSYDSYYGGKTEYWRLK